MAPWFHQADDAINGLYPILAFLIIYEHEFHEFQTAPLQKRPQVICLTAWILLPGEKQDPAMNPVPAQCEQSHSAVSHPCSILLHKVLPSKQERKELVSKKN